MKVLTRKPTDHFPDPILKQLIESDKKKIINLRKSSTPSRADPAEKYKVTQTFVSANL